MTSYLGFGTGYTLGRRSGLIKHCMDMTFVFEVAEIQTEILFNF